MKGKKLEGVQEKQGIHDDNIWEDQPLSSQKQIDQQNVWSKNGLGRNSIDFADPFRSFCSQSLPTINCSAVILVSEPCSAALASY